MALTTHGLDAQLHEFTSCLSALHAWFARSGLAVNGNKSGGASLFGRVDDYVLSSLAECSDVDEIVRPTKFVYRGNIPLGIKKLTSDRSSIQP